jgi:tetratricopeptide (TPR) repeat protein/DNA-binding winged helix-turn-helix (wHTH) protein/TolB-like protein
MIPRVEEKERVLYEFDAFRVDPVRRLLLRDGEPMSITPKAFSILLILIEQAGEVVEKSELIEKIWPGAFVTEANLTQNIFSLRKCLGERANDNRYIVTVPGQGYSFAGDLRRIDRLSTAEFPIVVMAPEPSTYERPVDVSPVEAPPVKPAPAPAMEPFPLLPLRVELPASGSFPAVVLPPAPEAPVAAPAPPPAWWWRWLLGTGGAIALLLAIAAAAYIFKHLTPASPARSSTATTAASVRPSIAVLEFKSLSPTADSRWLETAFAEMLTTELAAGGKLRVIPGERVAQSLRSLALRDPGGLGPEDLGRLRDTLGADMLVIGSFLPMKGQIRLDLRVIQIPGGDTVTSLVEVGTQSGLFDLVSKTGGKLRDSLGVVGLSAEQVRQAQALRPSSPESSRLYSEGIARQRSFDLPGALESLQKAAAADPGSAVIHSALSQAWTDLGYDANAIEEAQRALELASLLSHQERLAIEGRLHKAKKEWDKAIETYRSLWTFFPDDIDYGLQLADSQISGGRNADAVATLNALRKLPPPAREDPRIDVSEARNARRLSDVGAQLRAARAGVEKGRRSGQELVVSQGLIYLGDALIKTGKPREAVPLLRESAELAKKAGYSRGYGQALANVGVALQALGDLDGSEKYNTQALAIAQQLGSATGIAAQYYIIGLLHVDRGDLKAALDDFDQALVWDVRNGDRQMQARVLSLSADVLVLMGDLVEARKRCEQALSLSQEIGAHSVEAVALGTLGSVLEAQGSLAEARRRYEQAFSLLRKGGDANAAAWALAASSGASARLGDLRVAWQHSAQAQASKQQAGDRVGLGRVLGLRARIAYQMGDPAASRTLAEEQFRVAGQTGARSLIPQALQNRGRSAFAAGDLPTARAALEEALQASSSNGVASREAEVRLDLAELDLASDQAGQAAALARQAAAWYHAREIGDGEARAQGLLAEALFRQGLRPEALAAAASAGARLESSEDRELRIALTARLARIQAGAGNPSEAVRQLRRAVEESNSLGFTAAGLEAKLTLGEVLRRAGDPTAAAALAAVRKEAESHGFKRLAQLSSASPAAR